MHPSFIRLVWPLLLLLVPLALAGRAHAIPPAATPAAPATPTAPIGQPLGTPTMTALPVPALRDAAVVWARPGLARITWSSDEPLLCVGKYDAEETWQFLDCAGDQVEDTAPAAGDEFLILSGGQVLARLPLVAHIALPVVAR